MFTLSFIKQMRNRRGLSIFRLLVIAGLTTVLLNIGTYLWHRSHNLDKLAISVSAIRLAPDTVDFGTVGLGEVIKFHASVHNVSNRAIDLDDPITDCGCVVSRLIPRHILPASAAQLDFAVQSPMYPASINRSIVLHPVGRPDVEWRLWIRGRSDASVWSEPSSLTLEHSDGVSSAERVSVHFQEGLQPGLLRSDSSDVIVEQLSSDVRGVREYLVNLKFFHRDKKALGSCQLLLFSESGDRSMLRIPVSWKPRPTFRCVPELVRLTRSKSSPEKSTARILVYAADSKGLKVQPVANGVTTYLSYTGPNILISVTLEPGVLATGVKFPILKVTDDAHANETIIHALVTSEPN